MTTAVHRDITALSWVFVGGVAGTAARFVIERVWPTPVGGWPWATLVINVAGAFVLGVVLEALVRSGRDTGRRRTLRLLLGSGFCGAFTTYSTFALETVDLARSGAANTAAGYVAASVVLGLSSAFAGIVVAARLHGRVAS